MIPTTFFNPVVTTEKDTQRSKIFSDIKVKDFIEYEDDFYILSEDNKVHVFDSRKGKFINVFTITGIDDIQKITVHNHLKVGEYREHGFYIAFLSGSGVYLSKLKNNRRESILTPIQIFDTLESPMDIYLYKEYYENIPGIYQDNIVILTKENDKNLLSVYNLETRELIERLNADINLVFIGDKKLNQKIDPRNIINFYRRNMGVNEKRRVFLNTIKVAPDNTYAFKFGTITPYRGDYILPDIKNKALWIKDGLWLFKNHMISLEKVPQKAYVLSGDYDSTEIYKGRSSVRFLIKYQNSNTLEVIRTKNSTSKKFTDFARDMFWLLVRPFVFIGYALAFMFR